MFNKEKLVLIRFIIVAAIFGALCGFIITNEVDIVFKTAHYFNFEILNDEYGNPDRINFLGTILNDTNIYLFLQGIIPSFFIALAFGIGSLSFRKTIYSFLLTVFNYFVFFKHKELEFSLFNFFLFPTINIIVLTLFFILVENEVLSHKIKKVKDKTPFVAIFCIASFIFQIFFLIVAGGNAWSTGSGSKFFGFYGYIIITVITVTGIYYGTKKVENKKWKRLKNV